MIQQTLKKIENDQKEMLSLVRNSDKVMENIMDGLEISDIFPLKDLESLEKVETVNLKDPQFKNKLVSILYIEILNKDKNCIIYIYNTYTCILGTQIKKL